MVDNLEGLVERLRNPMWVHSNHDFASPQLDKEATQADLKEAADALTSLSARVAEVEGERDEANARFYSDNPYAAHNKVLEQQRDALRADKARLVEREALLVKAARHARADLQAILPSIESDAQQTYYGARQTISLLNDAIGLAEVEATPNAALSASPTDARGEYPDTDSRSAMFRAWEVASRGLPYESFRFQLGLAGVAVCEASAPQNGHGGGAA